MILDHIESDDVLLINKAKRIIEVNPTLSFKELWHRLKKKDIPESIIDEVLILNEGRELENAIRLLRIKAKTAKGKTPIAVRQKLLRHLMSKGFSYAISSRALSDLDNFK